MVRPVLFAIIFLVLLSYGCIEPFSPKLGVYKPILVVEGLLTNENISNIIKLTYSFQNRDSVSLKINDAIVYLTDDTGDSTTLKGSGEGIYKTDSLGFRGTIGKTYSLHIRTSDGKEYISSPCTMLPVPGIDSIYFLKDEQLVNNQTAVKKGISVFVDSKPGPIDKYFIRWDYDETWKIRVPEPVSYTYINSYTILKIPENEKKEYCWKTGKSTEIIIKEVLDGSQDRIMKHHINFIAGDESDRLTVRYSILIKQYSISEEEYNFWRNLQKLEEFGGDIFGPQPFEISSNITNINNPGEKVIGYFQVSAVNSRRKYIDYSDIYPFGLPGFNTNCTSYYMVPDSRILNPETEKPYTWDEFFIYMKNYYLVFTRPVYYGFGTDSLKYLVYTTEKCADCALTGSAAKPKFWIDR